MNYRDLLDPAKLASISQSAAALVAIGAVVGGTIAAIDNIQKVAKGEHKSDEAFANVAKEALGTGLSTAAGAAVMSGLGIGGLVGLAGLTAVSVVSKGLLDSVLFRSKSKAAANA
jgi:hypothetical protein